MNLFIIVYSPSPFVCGITHQGTFDLLVLTLNKFVVRQVFNKLDKLVHEFSGTNVDLEKFLQRISVF